MGHVILGIPGKWAENNHEISNHYTTKIGGLPDWPSKELGLRPEIIRCSLCGASLCLVTQVYAPISLKSLSIEERVIYIFACPMQKCARDALSWRTIRVQKWQSAIHSNDNCSMEMQVTNLSKSVTETHNFQGEYLCERESSSPDDDSDSDLNLEELGQAFLKVASLASCSKKQNIFAKSEGIQKNFKTKAKVGLTNVPVIPCFYICSQEEPSVDAISNACTSCSSLSLTEKQSYLTETSDEEKWEGEHYEYDRALGADRTYLKFKKRLDMFPEQCFRYLFGGKPLLAEKIADKPGACDVCGATRHYELQLMPPLLYFLQEVADGVSIPSLREWDWMTVIIYTCPKSCFRESCIGDSGANSWTVVEESTIIQYEDLSNYQPMSTSPL